MATISINIGDTDIQRVVSDICGFFNYQAVLTDFFGNQTPNPETPNQFARRMVVQTIKSWVTTYESQQAAAAATASATQSASQVGIS